MISGINIFTDKVEIRYIEDRYNMQELRTFG
jgi:hypothetical protein